VPARDEAREIPVFFVVFVVGALEANIARTRCHSLQTTARDRVSHSAPPKMSVSTQCQPHAPALADIAKMIDHSMLAPTITLAEFDAGIQLALDYEVASVCIVPSYLRRCAERLAGSTVKPSTTIGFPHGGQATAAKVAEARFALGDGAVELDMVINLHHALSADWAYVTSDVRAVLDEAHARRAKLKVIFENCYLSDSQKIRLCEICGELGADWVKTSTGFGSSGATLADLRLMREHSPPAVQVKASGGVKDLDFVLAARAIGVSRCGSSRTRELLEESKRRTQ
jgi:deoxyribose-phosphate aldolase